MNFSRFLALVGFLATLGGCATLKSELRLATQDVSDYRNEAELWGVEPSHDHYIRATQLWPWASGAQLHRRALALSLKPNPAQIEALSQTSEAATEIKILSQLLGSRLSRR